MDTNNNKQCECNKPKVVNDLLKRISNLEFDVEDKQREIENLKQINEEHQKLNGELRVENDRLNNIINELEKWSKEMSKGRLERTPYDEVWVKIKELKGDVSNGN